MSHPSPSNDEPKKPHPWLLKHYEAKRERTINLVKAAIAQLKREEKTVTIEAICRKSVELDSEGRGVKKSSIFENPVAHAYYREHSDSYQATQVRKRQTRRNGKATPRPNQPLRIDPHRDVERVRSRYMQRTKAEVVERLLMVEQAYTDVQQQLARLQFQLFEQEQQQEEEQRQAGRPSQRKGGKKQNDDKTEE